MLFQDYVNLLKEQNIVDDAHSRLMAGFDDQLLEAIDQGRMDANMPNSRGVTLLMTAIYMDHIPFIRALLNRGAHVDHADHEGNTALMYAIILGRKEVVSILCTEYKVNLEVTDKDGNNIRDIAIAAGDFSMLEMLTHVAHGAKSPDSQLSDYTVATRELACVAYQPSPASKTFTLHNPLPRLPIQGDMDDTVGNQYQSIDPF